MFVCPVPKISQVMIKWRCRASHLGIFTLCHNGCRATQLGRFTLCSLRSMAVLSSRAHEWRSREKNKVAPAPISSRFLCLRPPLLLSTPNQNCHATQAILCDTLAAELHNSVYLPCGTIDCLQSAFSLLNPSSSYLIQRDCRPRSYYY